MNGFNSVEIDKAVDTTTDEDARRAKSTQGIAQFHLDFLAKESSKLTPRQRAAIEFVLYNEVAGLALSLAVSVQRMMNADSLRR